MEIIVADNAGFCFGVNRAMDLALEASEKRADEVYTLGPLIHNPQAVKKLTKSGIKADKDINNITSGNVVIRSHGVPPEVLKKADEKGLSILDATCPFVKRAQQKAEELKDSDYEIVISGDKQHPEVVGILGYADNNATVIEDRFDFIEIPEAKKIGIVAQTTQSVDNLKELVDYLLDRTEELRVFNTICNTTEERQKEAAYLADKVDLMLVIGGYNSANTNRLAKICQDNGAETYHIESAAELNLKWFENIKKVGITAGASTPNWIIKEVVNRMTEEIKEQTEKSETAITRNDIVNAVVEEITEDGVKVGIDGEAGFIPLGEFEDGEAAVEDLTEGDELEVFVLNPDEEGQVLLSVKKAKAWREVEELHENGEIITSEITREVKGGLVADIGLRGFIPASHVAIEFIEDLGQFVGEELELKIIEVERENNNVVLSRRVILEMAESEKKQEILDSLEISEVVEGKVTKLVDFGAFVDLGGIEGLLHISEISWDRIEHPSVELEEGEEIKVKILDIDKEEERISLGLKQTQPDPWEKFVEAYEEDQVVTGEITNTVEFGAFMEIEPGVEGLIHISEISHKHIAQVEDVLEAGDEAEAKIININLDNRRVGLSLKALEDKPETSEPKQQQRQQKQQRNTSSNTRNKKDDDESIAKIGDVFGDLFDE